MLKKTWMERSSFRKLIFSVGIFSGIYGFAVLSFRLSQIRVASNNVDRTSTYVQADTSTSTYRNEAMSEFYFDPMYVKDQLIVGGCIDIDMHSYKYKSGRHKQTQHRYSDRHFPTSSVNSFANCDLPNATCKYFYPANFFDEDCGVGKNYSHFIAEMEEKRLNATLWTFMPKVGFPTLSMRESCLTSEGKHYVVHNDDGDDEDEDEDLYSSVSSLESIQLQKLRNIGLHIKEDGVRCMTERLTFLHVHKVGGSSLHNAFNYMGQLSKSAYLKRHRFFIPFMNPSEVSDYAGIREDARRAISHASKYPAQEFAPEQHVIFALVRDPLERFISSIGQVMGASGSFKNHLASSLKAKCLKSTSSETLRCVAKHVKEHSFWIELHFTPQVMDISFATLYQDVPVSVLPFHDIKIVLEYFGRGKVWDRNGSAKDYRADTVLTEMTVEDYDDETTRIVCDIYEMDVTMLRSLGIEVPMCDPYVPRVYNFVE